MRNRLLLRSEKRRQKENDPVRKLGHERRKELMSMLPAFITYPRTGSQWLEAVIEKYAERPCLRERRATLIPVHQNDWMFFHDHDPDLKLEHDNVLYLYRSPVETVYSYLIYRFESSRRKSMWGRWRQRGDLAITPKKIDALATAYRKHLEKWLLSEQRARTAVRYEILQARPNEEFAKIFDHFGLLNHPLRLKATLEEASRTKMVEIAVKKIALNPWLLSEGYQSGRQVFRKLHGQRIKNIVMTPELAPHFNYLEDQE